MLCSQANAYYWPIIELHVRPEIRPRKAVCGTAVGDNCAFSPVNAVNRRNLRKRLKSTAVDTISAAHKRADSVGAPGLKHPWGKRRGCRTPMIIRGIWHATVRVISKSIKTTFTWLILLFYIKLMYCNNRKYFIHALVLVKGRKYAPGLKTTFHQFEYRCELWVMKTATLEHSRQF